MEGVVVSHPDVDNIKFNQMEGCTEIVNANALRQTSLENVHNVYPNPSGLNSDRGFGNINPLFSDERFSGSLIHHGIEYVNTQLYANPELGKITYKLEVESDDSNKEQPNASPDENVAAEALRQLGSVCNDLPSFVCSNCSLSFLTSEEFREHSFDCNQIATRVCHTCGRKVTSVSELEEHNKDHQFMAACKQCNVILVTEDEVTSHLLTHQKTKSYQCPVCKADFQRPSSLSNHIKIHNYPPGRALVNSIVPCKTEFIDPSSNDLDLGLNNWALPLDFEGIQSEMAISALNDRILKNESALNCTNTNPISRYAQLEVIVSGGDKQSATKGSSCEKSSTKMTENVRKMGKHACPECDKRFITKQKMFRHMWIHRKKTFTCETCAATFITQASLDEHRISQHPGNTPYVCGECGKCFVSRQGLWEHGRIHGTVSTEAFKCSSCGKSFASRQGFLIHTRTHTGERPYGCSYCFKRFRDGGTLRKHERIHTGERPHACPICLRAFNQKVVLREHVRWLHAANTQETEDGLFFCNICGTKAEDRDELVAHIVKHSDQMAAEAKSVEKTGAKADRKKTKRASKSQVPEMGTVSQSGGNCRLPTLSRLNQFGFTERLGCLECDMCRIKFTSKDDLLAHVYVHI